MSPGRKIISKTLILLMNHYIAYRPVHGCYLERVALDWSWLPRPAVMTVSPSRHCSFLKSQTFWELTSQRSVTMHIYIIFSVSWHYKYVLQY